FGIQIDGCPPVSRSSRAPPLCRGCPAEELTAMSEAPGNGWQRMACLWAAACIAGCAAPPARYKPLTLRPAGTPKSIASQPSAPSVPAEPPPKAAAGGDDPGHIRLAAHESVSESSLPADSAVADESTTSEHVKPAASDMAGARAHPIDLGT